MNLLLIRSARNNGTGINDATSLNAAITGPAYRNALKLIMATRMRDDWLLCFDACLDKKIAEWECLHKTGTSEKEGFLSQEQFATLQNQYDFDNIVYCEFNFPMSTFEFMYSRLFPTLLKSTKSPPKFYMVKDASFATVIYQQKVCTIDEFSANADEYFTMQMKYFPQEVEVFDMLPNLEDHYRTTQEIFSEILERLD